MEDQLARLQPCGCVVCICDNEEQCQGCGAKSCKTHPVGEMPNPIFEKLAKRPYATNTKRRSVTITEPDWKALKQHGNGNASAGIRKLLKQAEA